MRFWKSFCRAVLQFVLKLRESIKVIFFFDSDYELIKQFISINFIEIFSKRVKFLGTFVSITSLSLRQHGTQAKSSKQAKTTFYQMPV